MIQNRPVAEFDAGKMTAEFGGKVTADFGSKTFYKTSLS
jgi:hypothetical protein